MKVTYSPFDMVFWGLMPKVEADRIDAVLEKFQQKVKALATRENDREYISLLGRLDPNQVRKILKKVVKS